MRVLSRGFLPMLFSLLSACVSVQVDPLTPVTFEPRDGKQELATLEREPNRRFVQIAPHAPPHFDVELARWGQA